MLAEAPQKAIKMFIVPYFRHVSTCFGRFKNKIYLNLYQNRQMPDRLNKISSEKWKQILEKKNT